MKYTPATMPGRGDEATWGEASDPRDPRFVAPDDWLDEDTARDLARDDALSTPGWGAEWLHDSCAGPKWQYAQPLTELARRVREGDRLDVPELLVLLLAQPATAEGRLAAHYLRERFEADNADEINARARELLREQEREADRDREESIASHYEWRHA